MKTVYELIQALSKFDPDAELVIHRTGQRRSLKVLSVYRDIPNRRGVEDDKRVRIMLDWDES